MELRYAFPHSSYISTQYIYTNPFDICPPNIATCISMIIHCLFQAVQQVISNLLVSNIELRSEDSVDIKPYTHQRQVEKIVIKLGDELEFFKTKFLRVRMLRKFLILISPSMFQN
jgi:hypothetical protein